MFVFFYGLFASYIIQKNEQWTYVESTYFTFISILTVGELNVRVNCVM
uniref:Ion_trans_2 domain-containing protein n=1 Tax=Heterorhabditis bacteriophora TaxID=37862 RepID=A0A1I7WKY0_HETBA